MPYRNISWRELEICLSRWIADDYNRTHTGNRRKGKGRGWTNIPEASCLNSFSAGIPHAPIEEGSYIKHGYKHHTTEKILNYTDRVIMIQRVIRLFDQWGDKSHECTLAVQINHSVAKLRQCRFPPKIL